MPARAPRRTAVAAPSTPSVAEPTAPAFDPEGSAPPVAAGEPTAPTPPSPAQPAAAPPGPGYRGLKVWQRAMDLATGVYMLARGLPDEEHDGIGAELRQTVIRIPAAIAAGNSLFNRAEYVHSLSTAHGALARLESSLLLAERLGLARGKSHAALLSNAADVGRMLRALIRALQPPAADADVPAGGRGADSGVAD